MTLADTGFLIDLMRLDRGAMELRQRLEAEEGHISVPAVVVDELARGIARAKVPVEERARVRSVLRARPVLPLDEEAASTAGSLEGTLAAQGIHVDPEDALIAGVAIANRQPLATRNVRHFGRFPGLRLVTY